LRIFAGNWNWTGKILAVLGSVIFLMIYRKFTLSDYYLTFHQNKGFFRKGFLIIVLILVVQSIFSLIINTSKNWNTETFFFQLTMPGIDEEIAFRGVMLGLLIKTLKPSSKTIFHPAILVTSILFGLVHGLFLNESYELNFRSYPFFNTMILGIIWAWITMKSGSILLALVSHNLANVGIQLIRIIR
jgi:membrane protease YdiL (CAAX protease family)